MKIHIHNEGVASWIEVTPITPNLFNLVFSQHPGMKFPPMRGKDVARMMLENAKHIYNVEDLCELIPNTCKDPTN